MRHWTRWERETGRVFIPKTAVDPPELRHQSPRQHLPLFSSTTAFQFMWTDDSTICPVYIPKNRNECCCRQQSSSINSRPPGSRRNRRYDVERNNARSE
ncbi:MAG: hypothetical protein V1907_01125 [Candidatus Kerfeldbacteria bacterium]